MASERPSAAALPYWTDYLKSVLRPRVESVLQRHMDSWNDVVWEVVARAVAEDQEGPDAMTPEQIRALLQDQLGMQLEVDVNVRFTGPDAAAASGSAGQATGQATGQASGQAARASGEAEVIDADARRRVNISPLAKAVGGGGQRR